MECQLCPQSRLAFLNRLLLAKFESWYDNYGKVVAQRPWKFILVALLLVALAGLGLIRLDKEKEIEKLFVPENTDAERALQGSKPYFLNLLNSREQAIIFQSGPHSSLFQGSCLQKARDLLHDIISESTFQKHCCKKASSLNQSPQYNASQTCFLISPFELISNLSRASENIDESMKDNSRLMSNGRTAADNQHLMFDKHGSLTTSLRAVLYLNEYKKHDHDRKEVLQWEKNYVERLKKDSQHKQLKQCFSLKFSARRSLDDAILESASTDTYLVSIAFALMITFSRLAMGSFVNPVKGHSTLSNVAILSIALGILAGFGCTMWIGVPFLSLVGILPFLVLSVGIDDMFIISGEFDAQASMKDPSIRVGATMAKIGTTITMTTLTDVVAFLVSSTTTFPAIRYFFIFAAMTFTAEFLLQMTFFLAFFALEARRINASRRDCLPFWKGQNKQMCCMKIKDDLSKRFMKSYAEKLLSKAGKAIGIGIAVTLLALGIYGCLYVDHSFDRRTLIVKKTYLREYLDAYENNFNQTVTVNLVVNRPVNYEDQNIVHSFLEATTQAQSTGYYVMKSDSWMREFVAWQMARGTEKNFKNDIRDFLSIPKYAKYREDLRFDHDGILVASQIQVYMKQSTSSQFQRDAMLQLRKVLQRNSIHLVPTADQFLYFEQYAAVTAEVIQNICIASVVIILITSPFCIFLSISLLLLVGFVLLIVELIGVMYFFNVPLNAVSMINLVMSVGFAVDYSAHVAHAFVTSTCDAAHDKIVEGLSSIGAGVLLGGFSTFLGMLPTAFASSDIFQIFFRMFMGIVLLGLFNGLVLLPILFSWMGPLLAENKVDTTKKAKKKEQNKSKPVVSYGKTDSSLPVTIVGLAARFPTARNKDQFWQLLLEGRNTRDKFPLDRGQCTKRFEEFFNPTRIVRGRIYVTSGSYMESIDMFDNSFFGISKSEAIMMDPQQRLLLQGVIEAMEDAGMTLKELQSVNTGVYVGAMNFDYTSVFSGMLGMDINQFTGTGSSGSIIANRISFALNLTGPSITVDTACSSSLTALNVAFEHLKSGKCDVAIVGAANIIVDQNKQVTLCQANMLAPDGQSKAFDARCDGYGRGEGMVVIILKQSSGKGTQDNSIYCNLLACNINNDGQSAIPITAPSVSGQKKLFEATCMDAGVDPERISYLEAHGTGTVIGDLVETQSISQAYCTHRSLDNPLRIGSVKSNINHTESTAGLAGLAKVCLMMKHRTLVPTVGIQEFNKRLDLKHKGLHVGQESEKWTAQDGLPLCAAVNSFGFGGSNAHLILREPDISKGHEKGKPRGLLPQKMLLLPLSAKSKAALSEQALRLSHWLSMKEEDQSLALDLCYSLACRRTLYNHRLSLAFSTIEEAYKRLSLFGSGSTEGGQALSYSRVKPTAPKTGFVFGGQGSDWEGMVSFFHSVDAFKVHMEEVDSVVEKSVIAKALLREASKLPRGIAFSDVEFRGLPPQRRNGDGTINELTALQLSIFKSQYAMAKVLTEKCKVSPVAVAGHSLGDIAAACVAGCISLKNAVDLIIVRSELQNTCRGDGDMVAVGFSETRAKETLTSLELDDKLQIAAINDSQSVTISGDHSAILELIAYLSRNKDIFWKLLPTAKAYHSHHMDSIQSLLWRFLNRIKFKSTWKTIQFVSTVYAKPMAGKELTAAYWWDNVREPVNFLGAVQNMIELGCQAIIEISPKPVLKTYLRNICASQSEDPNGGSIDILTAMPPTRNEAKLEHFYAHCLGQLMNIGCPVDLYEFLGFQNAAFVRYPTYAWQESKFWPEAAESSVSSNYLCGPLQGTDETGADVYQKVFDLYRCPFLQDHQLRGIGPVFPGAGYVEVALESVLGGVVPQCTVIRNQTFDKVFPLSNNTLYILKTFLRQKADKSGFNVTICNLVDNVDVSLSTLEICTLKEEASALSLHEILSNDGNETEIRDCPKIQLIKASSPETISAEEAHTIVANAGIECGDAFSLLEKLWMSEGKILGKLRIPSSVREDLSKFVVHPSIIDASLQCTLFTHRSEGIKSIVPMGFQELVLLPLTKKATSLYVEVDFLPQNPNKGSIQLMTNVGEPLLLIKDIKAVDLRYLQPKMTLSQSLYEVGYSKGTIEEVDEAELAKFMWIIVGLQGKKLHLSFKEVLQKTIASTRCEILVLEEEEENLDNSERKSMVKSILDVAATDKCSIVVNFVPAYIRDISVQSKNAEKAFQALFSCCLEGIDQFSSVDCRVTFVTSGNVVTPWDVPDCRENDYKGACVWGFVKAVRMENKSMALPCADISRDPSVEELLSLISHSSGSLHEPDVILRHDACYFPRLKAVKDHPCYETVEVRSTDLDKVPRKIHQSASGTFHCVESAANSRANAHMPGMRVDFASTIYGNLLGMAIRDESKVQMVPKQVLCCSGTVIANESVSNASKKLIVFRAGHEIESVIYEDFKDATPVPASMTLEQASLLPGCLSLASKVTKYVVSIVPSCRSCLVVGHSRDSLLPYSLMLSAKASGWDVSANEEVYSESMASLGVGFVGIQDLFTSGDFRCDDLSSFDCVIFPADSNECERAIFTSAIRPGGLCLSLVTQHQSHVTQWSGINRLEAGKKLAVYDCTSVTPHDLAQEWQSLCMLVSDPNYIWSLALQWDFDVIDPCADNEATKVEKKSACTLMVNKPTADVINVQRRFLSHRGLPQDKTYLVIGGHKGLGMESVIWLVGLGARHVITCGRSVLPQESQSKFNYLASSTSASITHVCCDITSTESICVLQAALSKLPTLGGILNSAVVYEDRFVAKVDYQNFKKVMGPKVIGTINLYEMVCRLNVQLDFFILYSSIVSTLGNRGQAAYAGANFFMNQFAAGMRRCTKQKFISICWGPMGGAGYLQENQGLALEIAKAGLNTLPIKTGLEWLETVLLRYPKYPVLALNNFNWKHLVGKNGRFSVNPMVRDLIPSVAVEEEEPESSQYLEKLRQCKSMEEKYALLADYVSNWFAGWLETTEASEVDLNAPLSQYGLDSGGAVTFQSKLENDFQVTVPLYELLRPDSSGNTLIEKIMACIQNQGSSDNTGSINEATEADQEASENQSVHDNDSREDDSDTEDLNLGDDFCAVAYAPTDPRANFFWVHSSHRYRGSMLSLANGFRAQDTFQIYSLGSSDILYRASERETVRSLAKTYTRLIRKVQPRGPYFLGGYSFGGIVALEMASILSSKKEKVALLAMLDTYAWVSDAHPNAKLLLSKYTKENKDSIKTQMKTILRAISISQLGMDLGVFERILEEFSLDEIVAVLKQKADEQSKEIPDLHALMESITINRDVSTKAHFSWRPPKKLYRGRILFVEASDKSSTPYLKQLGKNSTFWRDLTTSKYFYRHCVPADHLSLLENSIGPNLGKIISTMARFVLRAQFPALHVPEVSPIDRVSSQLLQDGLPAILGGKSQEVRGVLKVNPVKGRIKFRVKKMQAKTLGTKIILPLKDVVNVLKASESSLQCPTFSTMGITIWTHDRMEVFFFERWLDYVRVVNGLQAVFQMRLPLL